MKRGWWKVFVGAMFEVGWVAGLKHAYDVWTWLGTVIAIIVSFYLLINAGKELPAGSAYAVFVGLGTLGTVLCEMIFFGKPFDLLTILLIALLLVGVIGLKTVEEKKEEGERA